MATILEEARSSVVRTVNTRMVIAYWLIGREIVQEQQGGKKRAGYGDTLLEDLSRQLTEKYGRGYSVANLKHLRQFHMVYANRAPEIRHTSSSELRTRGAKHDANSSTGDSCKKSYAARSEFAREHPANSPSGSDVALRSFSPDLSWTHYRRALWYGLHDQDDAQSRGIGRLCGLQTGSASLWATW
ncbi:MAG: hypothetical protein HQ523_07555 [Lentisphaerae bacterium]|nr:hypothetical protein [Lentisphaerota bacterium]